MAVDVVERAMQDTAKLSLGLGLTEDVSTAASPVDVREGMRVAGMPAGLLLVTFEDPGDVNTSMLASFIGMMASADELGKLAHSISDRKHMLYGEHTTNRRAIGAAGCHRRASNPSATLKSLKKKQAEFWKWIKRCAFIQSCSMLPFLLVGGVMCLVPAHMAGGATECLAPPLVGVPDVSYNLPDTPLAGGASCLMQPTRYRLGRGCLMYHATCQVPPWQGVLHVSCNLPGTALAGGASCLMQPARYRLGRGCLMSRTTYPVPPWQGVAECCTRGTTLAGAWHIGVRVRGALCCAASRIDNVEVKITYVRSPFRAQVQFAGSGPQPVCP